MAHKNILKSFYQHYVTYNIILKLLLNNFAIVMNTLELVESVTHQ